jgi:hypothetical protein
MKHLKVYKIFELSNQDEVNINLYVRDLLSDIQSDGVRVFTYNHLPSRYRVAIGEYSDLIAFKYSDVSNEIKHMISYFINELGMRLGEVDVYFTDGKSMSSRLLGWEKLKQLESDDVNSLGNRRHLCSLTLNFIK